jgi:hypothetical protein
MRGACARARGSAAGRQRPAWSAVALSAWRAARRVRGRRHGERDVQAEPWVNPERDGARDFAAKHAGLLAYLGALPAVYELCTDADGDPAVRFAVLEID